MAVICVLISISVTHFTFVCLGYPKIFIIGQLIAYISDIVSINMPKATVRPIVSLSY